jgi:hypothetical protein
MDFKQAELDERNEDFMCDMVEGLLGSLRFRFSDSVVDKIAFNNPYRSVAANIPWRRDHIERESLA